MTWKHFKAKARSLAAALEAQTAIILRPDPWRFAEGLTVSFIITMLHTPSSKAGMGAANGGPVLKCNDMFDTRIEYVFGRAGQLLEGGKEQVSTDVVMT